jgi:2-polyprenyl-3-methyl-5-hydroxy-6-metoxy-1,4-benzoquinol methylase
VPPNGKALATTGAALAFSCPICRAHYARPAARYNNLEVVRCSECGHGYVWPVPPPAVLDQIYGRDAYYKGSDDSIGFADYRAEERARRHMFGCHLDRIEKLANRGVLLDVGCATGDFLKVASERGWEALGADPSSARAEVQHAGLRLVGQTVQDADLPAGSLDLVTFWDVLEHVPDPIADLRRARELLRPGALLALSVPDSANLAARVSGRRWFGYKTAGEHLQFFTRDSLRAALAAVGFEVLVQRATTWSCTIEFLAERVGLYLGAPGRLAEAAMLRSPLAGKVVDVPMINQLAIARAAAEPAV